MRNRLLAAAAMAMFMASSGALAHHSFSAEFDIGRPVEITGTLTEIEWTNPHAWLHLEVKNDKGEVEEWSVEMLGVIALVRGGMTPQTVKPGDALTITGFGARNGSTTANASSVKRADTGEMLWNSGREERN
ncbi:MAG: hypothetical protein H6978_01730 [Gammaproteobacteria bacterium]|nr:hypothetical protein [Gammaproteobacteria bacterium]